MYEMFMTYFHLFLLNILHRYFYDCQEFLLIELLHYSRMVYRLIPMDKIIAIHPIINIDFVHLFNQLGLN
jgi:hypothetical protein